MLNCFKVIQKTNKIHLENYLDQFEIVQYDSETNGLLLRSNGEHLEIFLKDIETSRFPLQYPGYHFDFDRCVYDEFVENIQDDPDEIKVVISHKNIHALSI